MSSPPPIALTIAGSDCSGGAGVQADLKTFQQLGVHGLSAVTSIVAETPLEVRAIAPVEIPLLQAQLNILHESYPINAVKTGLLPSRMCIIAIAEIAEILQQQNIPIVVDPVMVASTGTSLLDETTAQALSTRLLPLATLVTPNIPEAQALLKKEISSEAELENAAREIGERFQISCLVKGGHLKPGADRLDVLWHDGQCHRFSHPYMDLPDGVHGTGCTLSAAITAGLANNHHMVDAVASAVGYVQELLRNAHTWTHRQKTIRCLGW